MNKPKILLDEQIYNFARHIRHSINKRVLFSAPFGSGKSYFLDEFFNSGKQPFIYVKLSPIDYSVANNQDIFELIKHDLLLELTEKFIDEIELKKEDVNLIIAGKSWLDSKLDIFPFISILAQIGTGDDNASNIIHEMRSAYSKIRDHQKQLSIDEQDIVIKYLIAERQKAGSVREMDGITGTIKDFISRVKNKHPDKEFVLVIDDMDRLDPEHIFRLFNVFTAHEDSRTEQNKFGFDKVIFVCDIGNIYHIFRHKYGPNVDFDGYISKFYSTELFSFDLRKGLIESLTKFYLDTLKTNSQIQAFPASNNLYRFNKELAGSAFAKVLSDLIDKHILRIRNLTKITVFEPLEGFITLSNGEQRDRRRFPVLELMFGLRQLFPRMEDLAGHLKILADFYQSDYSAAGSRTLNSGAEYNIIGWSIPFVISHSHLLTVNREEKNAREVSTVNEHGHTMGFTYTMDWDGNPALQSIEMKGDLHQPKKVNVYYFLHQAVVNAMKSRFIDD